MGGSEWSALIGEGVPGKVHLSSSVARALCVVRTSDAELRVVGHGPHRPMVSAAKRHCLPVLVQRPFSQHQLRLLSFKATVTVRSRNKGAWHA